MVDARRAEPEDAGAIHRLMLDAFTPFRDQYTDDCFDATVQDPERIRARMHEGPLWVAEDDDRIIGTVSAMVDPRGVYVRGMAVHPDARRGGIGRLLLSLCEEYAREQEAPCLWLSTTLFLTASQALYRSFGFHVADGPPDLHGTALVSFEKAVP